MIRVHLFCSEQVLFGYFFSAKNSGQVFGHLDFKIVVEPSDAPAFTVVLLSPSRQEKAAWTSDISQVRAQRSK